MWREERLFGIASFLTTIFPLLLLSPIASDIGLCIIAVMFLLRCYLRRDWTWCKEAWVRILAMLWIYMIARGLFALHPKEALGRALPFARYIVFAAALARWTLNDDAVRRRFLMLLTCMATACALDGLLQYFAGHDLLLHPVIHDPGTGHIRLNGPFSKPILGIMLAWLAFPVLLPLLHTRTLALALPCLLAVTTAIALSGERMALLLTLFGWLMAIALLRPRRQWVCAGLAGLAALLGLLAFALPDAMHRQVSTTQQTLAGWQQSPYGLLLKSDLALAAQAPLLGLGADHFRVYCEALYAGDAARITAMCNTHPHNIWLEWLIEEGVIGLALFAAFVITVLRGCLRAWQHGHGNPLFAGWLIAFILRVWPFMSTTDFFSRWGAPPFWLALGALLVCDYRKRGWK